MLDELNECFNDVASLHSYCTDGIKRRRWWAPICSKTPQGSLFGRRRKLRSTCFTVNNSLLASALCVCNCVSFLFFLPEFLLCPGSGVQQGRRLYNSFPHSEVGVCFGNTLLAAHRSWSVLIGLWSVSSQQPSGIRTKKGINFRPQFWGAGWTKPRRFWQEKFISHRK